MRYDEPSKDLLAVEPLFLVEKGLDRQAWVVDSLLVPGAVAFGEERLSQGNVEVDHLVVDEGGQSGLGELRLGLHV